MCLWCYTMSLLALFVFVGLSQAQLHYGVGKCYDCHKDNFPGCLLTHPKYCHDNEECQINYDGSEITIKCRKMGDCERELLDHTSSLQPLCTHGGSFGHHACQICCTTESCVTAAVNSLNGQQPGTNSAWDWLKGSCLDQLEGSQCQTLHPNPAVDCNNRVSLRTCPQTCGLCSLYGVHAGCKDTVLNNGCAALDLSEQICSTQSGLQLCALTCNKCDALLDERINQALMTQQGSATIPVVPVTTPAVYTPDPLVDACGVLTGQTCDVREALCKLVNCPAACSQCAVTTEIVTPDDLITTEAPCLDILQNTNCSDVTDVCSSSLLSSYCPKYCGFCV